MLTEDTIIDKIKSSGEKGLWTGYIRANHEDGDELIDRLLKTEDYTKVKKVGVIGTNVREFKWAIVKNNF